MVLKDDKAVEVEEVSAYDKELEEIVAVSAGESGVKKDADGRDSDQDQGGDVEVSWLMVVKA